MPFIQNLGKLGSRRTPHRRSPRNIKSRTDSLRLRRRHAASGGSTTPGADLRVVYTSAAAAQNGSRNLAGISDPVVDALVETIAAAKSREALDTACRALDRVLRAGHYWVPMWYRDTA